MILLEINPKRIARIELESDAPRTVDVNRIAGRNETFQRVKIKPREVHVLGPGCGIQTIKPDHDAALHLGVDSRSAAFRPQLGQSFAAKRLDHGSCKQVAYACQRIAYNPAGKIAQVAKSQYPIDVEQGALAASS
jgi:hypothetical protein